MELRMRSRELRNGVTIDDANGSTVTIINRSRALHRATT
jgi:hypothetical protein